MPLELSVSVITPQTVSVSALPPPPPGPFHRAELETPGEPGGWTPGARAVFRSVRHSAPPSHPDTSLSGQAWS